MKLKNNNLVMSIVIIVLVLNLLFVNAEIDTAINAKLNNEDTDLYIQTDSSSSPNLDYLDFEMRGYPSGNYSFFYAVAGSNNLLIHSFNLSMAPQTFNLVYEVNPAQAGTLSLSWNSNSESYYTLTLFDYGTDSSRSTLVDTIYMGKVLSYSVSHTSATKRYFKITLNNATCNDGVQNQGEGGADCGGPCRACPNPASSCISNCAGKSCGDDGCGGSCGSCSSDKTCSSGACVLLVIDCSCSKTTCIGETCNNGLCAGELQPNCLGRDCGTSPNGCGSCGSCGEGFRCDDGDCLLVPLECQSSSDCFDGYSCLAGNCICSSDICKEVAEPPKEIPQNLLQIGEIGCEANFACNAWSACNVEYDVRGLVTGSDLRGERKRLCNDLNSCYANFEEIKDCSLKEEVVVSNKVWCGQEYTELQNLKGDVVARLKTLPTGKFVTVDLNAETNGYCYYCYNGIQDNDETGVDCGGSSCSSCDMKKEIISSSYFRIFSFVKIWLLSLIGIFLVLLLILIVLIRKLARHIKKYLIFRRAVKAVLIKHHSKYSPKHISHVHGTHGHHK